MLVAEVALDRVWEALAVQAAVAMEPQEPVSDLMDQ